MATSSKPVKVNNNSEGSCESQEKRIGCEHYKRRAKFVVSKKFSLSLQRHGMLSSILCLAKFFFHLLSSRPSTTPHCTSYYVREMRLSPVHCLCSHVCVLDMSGISDLAG